MTYHIQRVIEEQQALSTKIVSLECFLNHEDILDICDCDEVTRLARQLSFMESYDNVLRERITAFNDAQFDAAQEAHDDYYPEPAGLR